MKEKINKDEQKKAIDNIYYQKNRERIKEGRKQRYAMQRKLAQKEIKEKVLKYSKVENYKVLMTLKEYTLLSKEKQRKWLNFCWMLKDLAENGVYNVSEVMRLGELGENLLRDYRETAKKEAVKGKNWNLLTEKEQEKLAKFWGQEKVRVEMEIAEGLEEIAKKGEEAKKEFEMAKFHEERGKKNCECWQCQGSKELREEVKEEREEKEDKSGVKCPECQKVVKKLGEDSGVCRKCERELR